MRGLRPTGGKLGMQFAAVFYWRIKAASKWARVFVLERKMMENRRNRDCSGAPVRVMEDLSPSGAAKFQFMAWVPENLFHEKIVDFIRRNNACVIDHSADHVRMVIGKRGLLPWPINRKNPRLELVITLQRNSRCRNNQTHVVVDLIPIGSDTAEELDLAYDRTIRELRGSLMAESLDRRHKIASASKEFYTHMVQF